MGWMYCISGWMATYLHWWDARVADAPKRWAAVLVILLIVLTFAPAVLGNWGWVSYPIGWVFIIPGLIAANRHIKRAAEIKADQTSSVHKTRKLILLGQKEKTK